MDITYESLNRLNYKTSYISRGPNHQRLLSSLASMIHLLLLILTSLHASYISHLLLFEWMQRIMQSCSHKDSDEVDQ